MIQRKSSRITDSLVNSSHEDHFNVTKAIRDDAPITNNTTVMKSVNFEASRDGAYILRKPLVKKTTLNKTNQVFLSNKSDILTINNGQLSITGATKLILRFYDNKLIFHEYEYQNSMPVPWLTIKDSFNTSDHTLLNTIINHTYFLFNVDFDNNALGYVELLQTVDGWKWMLVNDTWDSVDYFLHSQSIGNNLKRFIKIYTHDTQTNTYVIEIVHPEFNSITSGLDEGNSQTLDVNLLLENPYAVRDLYEYGNISTTKILPYVLNDDDSQKNISFFNTTEMWELTEKNYLNDHGYPILSTFKILVETNPKVFNKKFLILKAFLTTAITSAKYYGCWERSKDAGVTWESLTDSEYFDRFSDDLVTTKRVSDITSADFDKALREESLTSVSSYLVTKKLVRLNLENTDYSMNDKIIDRPDILILENPNLSYQYRFLIYLDTEKEPPTMSNITHTDIISSFSDTNSGVFGDGTIIYEIEQNDATDAPVVKRNSLGLYNGDFIPNSGDSYPITTGNTLAVKVAEGLEGVSIKSVKVTLATWNYENSKYQHLGALVGYGYFFEDKTINLDDGTESVEETTSSNWGWENGPRRRLGLHTGYWPVDNSQWINAGYSKDISASSEEYDITSDNLRYIHTVKGVRFVNFNEYIGFDNTDQDILDEYADLSGKAAANIDADSHREMLIQSISVTYTVDKTVNFTSVYLVSTTGAFKVQYSNETKYTEDISLERDRLFNGQMFYNDSQKQLLVFSDRYVYVSGTNSAIIKLMNSLELPDTVSKIIPWRNYLLLFTPKAIYLTKYDASSDTYTIKTLSNSVGVPAADANTIIPILNSVYFKSGDKIYKLIPNLYYASDDILNIHQVSMGVNSILENIINNYIEGINFAYANADEYNIFIPLTDFTYRITYDFNKQVWTVQKYNIVLTDIITVSNLDIYLYDDTKLYYFKESLETLLADGLKEYCVDNNLDYEDYDLNIFNNGIPYADYPNHTPKEIIQLVLEHNTGAYEDIFSGVKDEIYFMIDFGQKSSNYTLDKQFLESKLIFTTQSIKDTFPITLDIYTDGVSRPLHWDANTDGALWKTSLDDVGILNTNFNPDGADYNGIFRQLIVKYSGRGKSIRHVISGYSKALFKFYSMDVRGRILPKKR